MRLSFDGSANGQHTLQDLADFIEACKQLGMPPAATLVTGGLTGLKTKLSGNGALRSISAEWDEHSVPASHTPAPVPATTRPFIPGLSEPTTPMPATPPPAPQAPVPQPVPTTTPATVPPA